MQEQNYDAIIIGARPAGCGLAIRLAKAGFNILIVDRAKFPSMPAVPSMPLVLPHTLELLDELGVKEAEVATTGAKIARVQLEFGGHFATDIDFDKALAKDSRQHYFYSIKRAPFDMLLWNKLAEYPNITARQEYGVSKLLTDASGKVIGIEGANGETAKAPLVVGADGRFSFVASQMKAESFNEVTANNTDFYYAYWRGGNYEHPDAKHTMHVYNNLNGYQYLIFPVGENEWAVATQMVHDLSPKSAGQSTDDYYLAELQKYPRVWNQIKSAEKISDVYGMKNVRNGYNQLGGAGWILAGDAAHFKDSIDAQGIYDALLGTKILAGVLIDWKAGKITWEAALQRYKDELLAATYDMFLTTQARLKRDIHEKAPEFVVKNVIRRTLQDPQYQERFLSVMTRRISPTGWETPGLMLGALLRGIGRDMQR